MSNIHSNLNRAVTGSRHGKSARTSASLRDSRPTSSKQNTAQGRTSAQSAQDLFAGTARGGKVLSGVKLPVAPPPAPVSNLKVDAKKGTVSGIAVPFEVDGKKVIELPGGLRFPAPALADGAVVLPVSDTQLLSLTPRADGAIEVNTRALGLSADSKGNKLSGTLLPDPATGKLDIAGKQLDVSGMTPGQTQTKTLKIGGKKYKVKVTMNADGTFSVECKRKRGFFSKLFGGLGNILNKALPIASVVASFIPGLQIVGVIAKAWGAVQGGLNGIKSMLSGNLLGGLTGLFSSVASGASALGAKAVSTFAGAVSKGLGLVQSGWSTLKNGFNALTRGDILGGLAGITSSIAQGAGLVADWTKGAVQAAAKSLGDTLGKVAGTLTSVKGGLSFLTQGIKSLGSGNLLGGLYSLAMGFATGAREVANWSTGQVKAVATSLGEQLTKVARTLGLGQQALNAIQTGLAAFSSGRFAEGVSSIFNALSTGATAASDYLRGQAAKATENLASLFTNVSQGAAKVQGLMDAVKTGNASFILKALASAVGFSASVVENGTGATAALLNNISQWLNRGGNFLADPKGTLLALAQEFGPQLIQSILGSGEPQGVKGGGAFNAADMPQPMGGPGSRGFVIEGVMVASGAPGIGGGGPLPGQSGHFSVSVPGPDVTLEEAYRAAMNQLGLKPVRPGETPEVVLKPLLDEHGQPRVVESRQNGQTRYSVAFHVTPYVAAPSFSYADTPEGAKFSAAMTTLYTNIGNGRYYDSQQLGNYLAGAVKAGIISQADAAKVVAYNDRSREVHLTSQYQSQLQRLGFFEAKVDGTPGPVTTAAVAHFQAANGLPVTGVADARTQEALLNPNSVTGAQVKAAQQALRDLGYYRGEVDGIWGAGSQQALKTFESAHRLPSTGRVNAQSLAVLQSGSAVPASKAPDAQSIPERVFNFFKGFGLEVADTVKGLGDLAKLLNDANPLLLPTGVLADMMTGKSFGQSWGERTGKMKQVGQALLTQAGEVMRLAKDLSTPAQMTNFAKMSDAMVRDMLALHEQGKLTPGMAAQVIAARTGQNPSIQAAQEVTTAVLDMATNYKKIIATGGDPEEVGRGAFRLFSTLVDFAKPAAAGKAATFADDTMRAAAPNRFERRLLEKLATPGSRTIVPRSEMPLERLARLTAESRREFAVLTKGSERMIIAGDATSVPLTVDELGKLSAEGWKLTAHSHVHGLKPSAGDGSALVAANQKRSIIVDSENGRISYTAGQGRGGAPDRLSSPDNFISPSQADANIEALRQGHTVQFDDVVFRNITTNGLGTPGKYNLDGAQTMRDIAKDNTKLDATAGYPETTHDISHRTLAGAGGRLNNSVYPDGINGILVAGDNFAMKDFISKYGGDVKQVDFDAYVQKNYIEPQLRSDPRKFQYALTTMDGNMKRLAQGSDIDALLNQVVDGTRSMIEGTQEYGFLNHKNYMPDNVPTPQSEAVRQAVDTAWADLKAGYRTNDRTLVEQALADLHQLQKREMLANFIPKQQAVVLFKDHITYHELLAEKYIARYGGTKEDYYVQLGDKFNTRNPILDLPVPTRQEFEAKRRMLFPNE